ncbi:hypothetical protein, partial [Pelomicrobium sp. G1]|uniref:hypothetical protein n=1 Tax=Pelomicrobium sp. G1 TaxID=3452920 RepID=UPI003F76DF5E
LRGAASEHHACRAGEGWDWDGVRFEFLSPAASDYADPRQDDNALSCVLRIAAADGSVLLPGDIGRAVERRLVQAHGPG